MKRLLTLAAITTPASAQCVMCFRTAAAQQVAQARALNAGILVLLLPPLVLLTGFAWLAWSRRES
jgi:hypothetical protein